MIEKGILMLELTIIFIKAEHLLRYFATIVRIKIYSSEHIYSTNM